MMENLKIKDCEMCPKAGNRLSDLADSFIRYLDNSPQHKGKPINRILRRWMLDDGMNKSEYAELLEMVIQRNNGRVTCG